MTGLLTIVSVHGISFLLLGLTSFLSDFIAIQNNFQLFWVLSSDADRLKSVFGTCLITCLANPKSPLLR